MTPVYGGPAMGCTQCKYLGHWIDCDWWYCPKDGPHIVRVFGPGEEEWAIQRCCHIDHGFTGLGYLTAVSAAREMGLHNG